MSTRSQAAELYAKYGAQYIAVNEAGRLRSKPPMRRPDSKFEESYERPIDAGIKKGHIVFYIHGGLNDLPTVARRIIKFDEEFKNEPWHVIHLAWDTSAGSSIDDHIFRLNSFTSWRNLVRLTRLAFPWNWRGYRRRILKPAAYFGSTIWTSQYDTALAATSKPGMMSRARNNGFYRAFHYLEENVRPGDGVKISFVVHSAGSIVANYLLKTIASDFKNLRDRVTNFVLLAPACHIIQFEDAVTSVNRSGRTVVMVLTPALEEADSIDVYSKSILWGVHDLFELDWDEDEFEKYKLPLKRGHDVDALWNRAILGLDAQVTELENLSSDRLDRSFGGAVRWVRTNESLSIANTPVRVWTQSTTHGAFDDDRVTLDSVKLLLR